MSIESTKIEIDFGVPEHGWLLINFRFGDFSLELDVSDVPADPMEQLCDALIQFHREKVKPEKSNMAS